jgi:hemerythrin
MDGCNQDEGGSIVIPKENEMAKLIWTDQLNTSIEVIDNQHRRIVDYINLLDEANINGHSREEIGRLINDLVDYTISHFGFEESLQEDANYPFRNAHKKVHGLFTTRVADFQKRFDNGEDIAENLHSLLVIWLSNHIKNDDGDYAGSVKEFLRQQHGYQKKKEGLFSRLFG